jgi:choline dehydrogenase
MVYIRGDQAQYDAWETLGNKGWNWDSVFSYAKKGEHFTPPTDAQKAAGASYDPTAHGTDGPLLLGFPFVLSNSSFFSKARDTWNTLGVPHIRDLNGGHTRGFVTAPMTVDRDAQVREDSSRAYYTPVEGRKNLKVIKGTVRRIVWGDDAGGKAVARGFEYISPEGKLVQIRARKEVILSASAYRNPLILEASGVGNPKILKKLGIAVKVDLPGVGESMQDHNIIGMRYNLSTPLDAGRIPYATLPTAHDAFGNATSRLASSTLAKLFDWASTASKLSDGALSARAIETRFRIQHDLIFNKNVTIAQVFPTNTGTDILQQFWTSMPFSWGNVHLASADRIDEPVIKPNLFTFDIDVDMLTAVGRLSRKAFATAPLSDLITTNTVPGYDALPLDASDEQWAGYLRANGMSILFR